MEKGIIYNKQTLEKREANKINLSNIISEKLKIPQNNLSDFLKDVKKLIIDAMIQIRDIKDENGKVEDNIIEIPNICAFNVHDVEKDGKKAYGIHILISEDILNSINIKE